MSFGLVRMNIEASQAKGSKFGMFTSHQGVHESSTFPSVTTHQSCTSRQPCFLSRVVNHSRVVNMPKISKSHNFSDLSSFLVLGIISSTDIQIEWFKLLWKENSEYYKFHEKLSWENVVWMDKNTLEPAACAWMVTLGDGMMPFRVLEYN